MKLPALHSDPAGWLATFPIRVVVAPLVLVLLLLANALALVALPFLLMFGKMERRPPFPRG